MHQDSIPNSPADGRAEERTNLFLAATLQSGGVAHPVKIRDLSSAGARIETFLVPEVGTAATLVRGSLGVDCHVSWNCEHSCGLHFSSPVSVHDWMTHPVILERRRLGYPGWIAAGGGGAQGPAARLEARNAVAVARDLGRVNRLLATLAEALADDPEMVIRHRVKLHNLGLAIQTLTALAEKIRASGGEGRSGRRRAGTAGG